jgi:hypothetical protein
MTRVSKIALISLPNQARITEVLIQSSFDGKNWNEVPIMTSSDPPSSSSSSSVKIDKSRGKIEGVSSTTSNIVKIKYTEEEGRICFLRVDNLKTRHLRITAKNYESLDSKQQSSTSVESPSSSPTAANPDLFDVGRELIGLKLELFGCYLELDRSIEQSRRHDKCRLHATIYGNEGGNGSSNVTISRDSSSSSWLTNSILLPAKHLSVNSQLNLIFVCEVSRDVR